MKEDLMEAKELEEKNLEPEKENLEESLQDEKNQEIEIKKEEIVSDENTMQEEKEEAKVTDIEEEEKEQDKAKVDEKQEDKEKTKDDQNKDLKNKVKKDKKKNSQEIKNEKKQISKAKKIIISIIIVAIVALLFSTVFALTNINNEKIISGVTIKGIEVSGLTKEEAIAKLETVYTEKMNKNIMLQYEELESELNPTLMEVNYDVEKAVNEACSLGRSGNIFVNNFNILGTLIGKRDFNVDMTMNEETTKQTINDIGANLPGIMIESDYSVEEDELIITRGKEGVVISSDTLLSQVKEMLNDIHETENVIKIPVETKTPQEIDVDKIHSEIYQEAQDAYYTKEPFTVYPEVEGIDFDVE